MIVALEVFLRLAHETDSGNFSQCVINVMCDLNTLQNPALSLKSKV